MGIFFPGREVRAQSGEGFSRDDGGDSLRPAQRPRALRRAFLRVLRDAFSCSARCFSVPGVMLSGAMRGVYVATRRASALGDRALFPGRPPRLSLMRPTLVRGARPVFFMRGMMPAGRRRQDGFVGEGCIPKARTKRLARRRTDERRRAGERGGRTTGQSVYNEKAVSESCLPIRLCSILPVCVCLRLLPSALQKPCFCSGVPS